MYCPNCGKENSAEQKFCRSCGLSLQAISVAVINELSAPRAANNSLEVVKPQPKRWQSPLLFGFLMLMLGLIIASVGKKVLAEEVVADVGTIISLLGVGLFAFKGVLLVLRDSRQIASPKAAPKGLPTTELPHALPSGEPASVTENTTRHFEPLYTERKAE